MAILEITTVLGCSVNCKYCPQNKIISKYSSISNITKLSLDDYKKVIDKLPIDVQIDFSGMAEPWLNEDCTEMVLYAHNKGHKITIYTTFVGMTVNDFERIKHINFVDFIVHLADIENNAHISVTKSYLEILKRVVESDVLNLSFMIMGSIPKNVEKTIKRYVPVSSFHSRAGNLDQNIDVIRQKKLKKEIYCDASRELNHNVLLPNGDVVLCCMDYGLQHVLGNLFRDSYTSLFRSEEFLKIKKGLKDESVSLLCRNCIAGRMRRPSLDYRIEKIKNYNLFFRIRKKLKLILKNVKYGKLRWS